MNTAMTVFGIVLIGYGCVVMRRCYLRLLVVNRIRRELNDGTISPAEARRQLHE